MKVFLLKVHKAVCVSQAESELTDIWDYTAPQWHKPFDLSRTWCPSAPIQVSYTKTWPFYHERQYCRINPEIQFSHATEFNSKSQPKSVCEFQHQCTLSYKENFVSHFVLHYICICKQLTKKVGQDCINLAMGLDFVFETICTNSHKIYRPAARRKAGKKTCNVMAGITLDRNNNFFLQGVQSSTLNFLFLHIKAFLRFPTCPFMVMQINQAHKPVRKT